MARIRTSKPEDNPRILQIWRDAVEATHQFVTSEDRRDIELEVASFIPRVTFDLAVDEADTPLAFMLIDNAHMEALFVDPACHGSGIGRRDKPAASGQDYGRPLNPEHLMTTQPLRSFALKLRALLTCRR
jgi:hypothetical protein